MSDYGFEQRSFQSLSVKLVVVTLFLITLTVWAIVLSPEHAGLYPQVFERRLRLDFINVGQGDSILVRTPKGLNFLIDGGMNVPLSEARIQNRELIQNYLVKRNILKLDGIVVTHFHNDHLGGIIPVLRQMKVKKIWDPGGEFTTNTYKEYVDLCNKKRIPRIPVTAGTVLDWGEELFVVVLHPEKVSKLQDYSAINNTSITLLIRFGKVSCLLTGDIEAEAQKEIAKYGDALKCQIMKVPHHGSDTSLYRPFLDFADPIYGVIQVGRGNPFGHPTQQMLSIYQAKGIRLYRTDLHGTIRLYIGGKDSNDFSFEVDQAL